MKIEVLDAQGKKSEKKIELRDEVWAQPMNKDLVAQALYIYRANQSKGTAHAKTRGEVRGGGIKPWKQKGTGRARQGSIRSPLWDGGGVTFPPRSYKKFLKLSDRMKRKAICCILSDRMSDQSITVVSDFDSIKEGKTKEMHSALENWGIKVKKVLCVARKEDNQEKLMLAGRNIAGVSVISPEELNLMDAMYAHCIITVPGAAAALEERLMKIKK